jgi:hypothetical protein
MRSLVLLAPLLLGLVASQESASPVVTTRQFIPEPLIAEDPQPDKSSCKGDRSLGACFHFTMEVKRGSAGFREVPLATPLCEGDSVAFRFTSSEDMRIAIDNFGTSGAIHHLYPFEGENMPLRKNVETRYPSDGGFRVDGELGLGGPHPGWEGMVIYRSPYTTFSAGLQATRGLVFRGIGDAPQESRPSDPPAESETPPKKPPVADPIEPAPPRDLSLSERVTGVRVRDLHPPAYQQKQGIYDQAPSENALFFKLRHVAAPCPAL